MSEFNEFIPNHSVLPTDVPIASVSKHLKEENVYSADPIHDVGVKALSDSIMALTDKREKEGIEDIHEVMSYHREEYVFNSKTLGEETLPHLRECLKYFIDFSKLTPEEKEEKKDLKKLTQTLNVLCDVSDAIANLAIVTPNSRTIDIDSTEEEVIVYFNKMTFNMYFIDYFLKPCGVSLRFIPSLNVVGNSMWNRIRIPVMEFEHNSEICQVMVTPCESHTPDWLIMVSKFRASAMEYLEEAQIHMENIATKSYADVFPEDEEID